ncbi:type I DNA topoisomerase [Candidatus Saccharibacteria bacterium]|nr:type I DNA topoisomerase [Candidatus Saccharibacteria bacterium]
MSAKTTTNLVIVESPAKAKTIAKYLGPDFQVLSSVGHIRSIAKKPVKGVEPIDTAKDFATVYEIDPEKKKTVAELRKAVKEADQVWLATDEDREGEAIAWHLCEVLKLDPAKTNRIVFHEITKDAIQNAVKNPRTVDMDLVKAQQARQILDRLVGFELSPVVWRKVPGGKSAGRVQSPAVKLLVEREREIQDFESSFVFKVSGEFTKGSNSASFASLSGESSNNRHSELVSESSVPHGKSSDKKILKQVQDDNNIIKANLSKDFATEEESREFLESLSDANFTVSELATTEATRNPLPPFTTSTLQQDANARLGMSARTTMSLAQQLYQQGKITYMRTDSLNLSNQFLGAAGKFIEEKFGKNYLKTRNFKTKSAGAQEAHEAIRPTDPSREVAGDDPRAQKLYDLIRRRTLASQMAPAKIERTTVTIEISRGEATGRQVSRATLSDGESVSGEPRNDGRETRREDFVGQPPVEDKEDVKKILKQVQDDNDLFFTAKGEVILFDGFLKMYGTSKEEILPKLTTGDNLNAEEITARQTFARPPARYTEGSLVKKLEELGIGRPSTYATIIGTIQTRGYAEKGDSEGEPREVIELKLRPRHSADAVSQNPGEINSRVDPATSLRSAQDDGEVTREILTEKSGATKGKLLPTASGSVVTDFLNLHFTDIDDYDFTARIENELDEIAEAKLDKTKMLRDFYGPFHARIDASDTIERSTVAGQRNLGKDPKTGQPIFARIGRFGPMLQMGETPAKDDKTAEKPRFANFPKNARLETVTLEQALEMFKLPRIVGTTTDGQEITANIGRFGPYIKVGNLFVSIKPLDPFEIEEKEARELYAAKLKAEAEKNIADFGDGLKVLNGRFGPYVTDGKKNAKIPKETDPKSITHEQAKKMIANAPEKKGRFARTSRGKSSAKKPGAAKSKAKTSRSTKTKKK